MWKDEIVEEIHQIREEYAKSFNYDLNAMFEDLRKKQAESGRKIVSRSHQTSLTSHWSGRPQKISDDAQTSSRQST